MGEAQAHVSSIKKNEAKLDERLGKAMEALLIIGTFKYLFDGNSYGEAQRVIPLMDNSGPSYSYGSNGNTIFHPGGNSKFSYGSNGSVYFNPGNCPVKPCG